MNRNDDRLWGEKTVQDAALLPRADKGGQT